MVIFHFLWEGKKKKKAIYATSKDELPYSYRANNSSSFKDKYW